MLNIRGDPHGAINCYLKAISIHQGVQGETRITGTTMNLGLLYTYLGELDKGLQYLNKAKEISFDNNSLENSFFLSFQFAMNYLYRGEIETSIDYMITALDIAIKAENVYNQMAPLTLLAYMHVDLEKREKAKEYIDELTKIN